MTTTLAVQMTPQGILIPNAAVQDWGEIEVIQEKCRIVIQPKILTPGQERELVIQTLRQDGLLVEMAGEALSPPVTAEERPELAEKLNIGSPLSKIVIEERRAGW